MPNATTAPPIAAGTAAMIPAAGASDTKNAETSDAATSAPAPIAANLRPFARTPPTPLASFDRRLSDRENPLTLGFTGTDSVGRCCARSRASNPVRSGTTRTENSSPARSARMRSTNPVRSGLTGTLMDSSVRSWVRSCASKRLRSGTTRTETLAASRPRWMFRRIWAPASRVARSSAESIRVPEALASAAVPVSSRTIRIRAVP